MVEEATPDSLVLLDELGRATDPEEGGALGVAILDHFRSIGAIVMCVDAPARVEGLWGEHAVGVERIDGFRRETLAPTYVLRVGAPGKSAGLDIATKLGLASWIIERARAAMTTTERDIARFLAELHDRLDKSGAAA